LVIGVDNLNNIVNLHAGQRINIQNANNESVVVNIIRIDGRSIIVEVVNSDDARYFNENDQITFIPPPAEGFKSKKVSKSKKRSKSKKVSKSKSKKVSKSKSKKVSKSKNKKVSKY
jgi:hypothetical protein